MTGSFCIRCCNGTICSVAGTRLTIENLELNIRWDGIFHSATYIFVLIGLFLLWRTAHRRHLYWSSKLLIGTMLLGFGLFNTVEGIVNHHLLGIHHVNEIAAPEHWVIWDVGFTLWGAAMVVIGCVLMRTGQRETPHSTVRLRELLCTSSSLLHSPPPRFPPGVYGCSGSIRQFMICFCFVVSVLSGERVLPARYRKPVAQSQFWGSAASWRGRGLPAVVLKSGQSTTIY